MTSSSHLRLQEAAALLQRGDAARALSFAEAAAKEAPNDPEAAHLAALALSAMGEIDRAAQAFETAAALHPRRDVILANLGRHLSRAGRHEAAAAAFERAAAAAPGSAEAFAALGSARARLGETAAADAAFRKALAIDARHAGALNGLGNLAAARGRDEDAAALFAQAIAAAPRSLAAHVNRGAALRKLGRLEESLTDLDRAASINAASPDAQFQRAATLRMMARFDEAGAAYRAALALAPMRADIHREYAGMMFEAGRGASAFELIDKAIDAAPGPILLVTRGELALLFGDIAAAQAAAARALAVAPEDARALALAANAARQTGAMDEALALARRAAASAPDDFAILHLCCEIELAAGHAAEAARRLARSAPVAHLQKHIALKATAMRAAGDPDYRRYYDYDRFTAQIAIDPPAGFSSIAAFNAALLAAIAPLHRTKQRPAEQTLYGGTQSPGRLWNENHPIIRLYAETMLAAARRFAATLPEDPTHPFLARKSLNLECAGAWSVMLASGGGHVDHIHPAGWISACYYVESPPEIFSGAPAGHLRLGAAGVAGLDLPAERYFPPTPGTVVFFPSYVWHGVEPFSGSSPRVTAPFDLAPG